MTWQILLAIGCGLVACLVYRVVREVLTLFVTVANVRVKQPEPRMELDRDILILRYKKDQDRYLFIGNDTRENRDELDRVLLMFACRGDLNLTIGDAAMLGRELRKSEPCGGR